MNVHDPELSLLYLTYCKVNLLLIFFPGTIEMICLHHRCEPHFHCLCVACVCKQMLIWLFLAHCYMQMWPSDLHTCFACIIPPVAWHFQSCSYALDCTLWLHRVRQIFKPTHVLKCPPASNTVWELRQTRGTCMVETFWRHVRSDLLFLTHRKHTGNFYGSTLVRKQTHSSPVCLAHFLNNMHTLRHTWWLRGLRASGAYLDLGLQWIITMMWCMFSILICQRGLGIVLTDGWAGPDRPHKPARSVLPPPRAPQLCSLPPQSKNSDR